VTIAWFDCETTNLDPAMTRVLEVALVVTDDRLEELANYSALVNPGNINRVRNQVEPFVESMHDESGLWEALLVGPTISLFDAELDMLNVIDECVGQHGTVTLGGMGVSHFDHPLITHQMDMLAKRLTYWDYDVSVVRRFFKLTGDTTEWPQVQPAHRAMPDVETAIWHAKEIKRRFAIVTPDATEA